MKKSRFAEAQIMGVPRLAAGGMPLAEPCRKQGIISAMFSLTPARRTWFEPAGESAPGLATGMRR